MERLVQEIADLHEFFEGWLGGELDATDEVFARVENALASDFHIITPRGDLMDREALLQTLRQGHGSRSGETFRIWIRHPKVRGRWSEAGAGPGTVTSSVASAVAPSPSPVGERGAATPVERILVTYEEWQEIGQETRGRISTALVERDPGTGGFTWLHMHETWLETQDPES